MSERASDPCWCGIGRFTSRRPRACFSAHYSKYGSRRSRYSTVETCQRQATVLSRGSTSRRRRLAISQLNVGGCADVQLILPYEAAISSQPISPKPNVHVPRRPSPSKPDRRLLGQQCWKRAKLSSQDGSHHFVEFGRHCLCPRLLD